MKDACSTRGVWPVMLVVAMSCGIAAGMAWSSDTVPVGVAKVDITPDTPIRMYGYASRTTESAGIAGPLTAKALVIGDDAGEGPAVLLTVDCGAVPDDIVQQVYARVSSQTKIARERFVLCNSHNHSGPDLKELMGAVAGGEQERLARYGRQLTDRLAAVVAEALARARRADWHSPAAPWASPSTVACCRTASGQDSAPCPRRRPIKACLC